MSNQNNTLVIITKDRFSIGQAGVSLVQLGEGELALLELVRETVLHQALRHLGIDKVPVSVSEWLLGSFVLIQYLPTQPIFTNAETAMLST